MSSVSVVIPCYKYGHLLRECVDSVVQQQDVDVRILIIDDSSPDDTPAVARDMMSHNDRIEYIRHAENAGHIETYNEGLAWASSDYTMLLSADDILAPGALGRAVTILDAHPEVGLVFGPALGFSTSSELPEPARGWGQADYRIHEGRLWLRELCRSGVNQIATPSVLVRTELQAKLGGYNTKLPHSADMEMWMRFALHADMGEVLDVNQAYRRLHPDAMHVTGYPAYKDVQQRREAFHEVFAEFGELVPEADKLLAERSVARSSIWAATIAYDNGETASTPINSLLQDAYEFYRVHGPDARSLKVYTGFLARRLMGRRLSVRVRSIRDQRRKE